MNTQVEVASRPKVRLLRPPFDGALWAAWDDLYGRDPEAHFFLASRYLRPILEAGQGEVAVLVVVWGGQCVGLLPMAITQETHRETGAPYIQINPPGRAFWADYAGFLIDPDHGRMALSGLVTGLRELSWDTLSLRDWRVSPARRNAFLSLFGEGYTAQARPSRTDDGKADNLVCPRLTLPETFDLYLDSLSKNTRQNMRRHLRRIDSGTLSLRYGGDADVDIVVRLWRSRWEEQKAARIDVLCNTLTQMLRVGLRTQVLDIPILERDGHVLGALASYRDPMRGEVLFFLMARDMAEKQIPVGLLLNMVEIRRAIADGYRVYDFLRGDEPYKFQLGAERHTIDNMMILNRGGPASRQ